MQLPMTDDQKGLVELWTNRFNRWASFTSENRKKWERWYQAYRCYVKKRSDNLSNLFFPYIFSMIETVQPRLIEATTSQKPYCGLLPVGPEDVAPAKVMEQLIQLQLDDRIGFVEKASTWYKDALIYGTAMAMPVWRVEKKARKMLTQKEIQIPLLNKSIKLWDKVETIRETIYDDNDLVPLDLEAFFFEPRAEDVESALWCGHLSYENMNYLKVMEANGVYTNIDEVEAMSAPDKSPMFKRLNSVGMSGDSDPGVDKLGNVHELMHCWENDRYTVICDREIVIYDGPNPYYHNRKPYVRIVDIPVPHEFYGIGEVEPSEYLQMGLNDITNAQMDYVMMSVLGAFFVRSDSGLTPKDLKLHAGKIIRVEDFDEVKQWQPNPMSVDIFRIADVLQQFMQNNTGAGDVMRGMAMKGSSTATEVSTVAQMGEARFRLKVRLINQMGIRQVARFMAWNNMQFIKTEKAMRVMQDAGPVFPVFTPELIQGNFDFVPAGVADEPIIAKESKRNNILVIADKFGNPAMPDPWFKQRALRKAMLEVHDIKDVDTYLYTEEEMAAQQAGQAPAQPPQDPNAPATAGGDPAAQLAMLGLPVPGGQAPGGQMPQLPPELMGGATGAA